MYPLIFEPLLKTVVWGGEKIKAFKGIDTDQKEIGESWEISGVEGNETIVKNGPLKGRSINDLIKEYKGRLTGDAVYAEYGDEFPLLIKFIDAMGDLSIQVHPDDELAARRHGCKGKTEMWYVIDADENASLYAGLSKQITPDEYERMVEDGTITDALCRYEVKKGDVFFLPAGRVHAICSGCFIAEIQQTSNITYRIFDYNRPGLDGKPRQLHTKEAKEAIDYTVYPDYRTKVDEKDNVENVLVECKYFKTSIWNLTETKEMDLSGMDSFMVAICIDGNGTVEASGESFSIKQGETMLIPADCDKIKVLPMNGRTLKLITSCIL